MKVWEASMNKEIEKTTADIHDNWDTFAETGICAGVYCVCCPFDNNPNCSDISRDDKIKRLNEEVK